MPPKRKTGTAAVPVEARRSLRQAGKATAPDPIDTKATKKQKTSGKKNPDTEAGSGDDTTAEIETNASAPLKVAASKKMKIGDDLPAIVLNDQSSNKVSLLDESKGHGIVLFSYPAASTPGCTSQACSYRDHYEAITQKGYKIFGISTDTVTAQEKFKSKQGFQYPLLSDPKKELLGVLGGSTGTKKTALRCHWVFKKGGALTGVEINVKPKDCVAKALQTIEEIEGKA